MPNLFDRVPVNFFNYLGSSSNHRIYADCLLLIYNEYENEISYRLPRAQIRDAVANYLAETYPDYIDEEDPEDKSFSDMAGGIIRRLCSDEVGWLQEDNDEATYEKQIIMSEQGIMLAEFIERLMMPEREEFSSYIFNIYNTLSNKDQWADEPYSLCLSSVYRNSRNLSKSLKKLATFIRRIIEEMMNESSFESLTENLISYCEGDFIKEYSRLTKRQNIHTYRTQIINMLRDIEESEIAFEELVKGCKAEHNLDTGNATERIYDMLAQTRHFLEVEYDAIMRDIKHKINVYLQIAVGRGRFLRNKGEDVRGSVEQTIRYLIDEMQELGLKDELPEDYMDLFNLEKNEFIDLNSIRYPAKQKAIKKATVNEYESISEKDIADAIREQETQAYNPYSKELMKEFLDKSLQGGRSINGDMLPLLSKNDLLTSLSAVAYSEENGFDVTPLTGYIETNDMLIRNFEIRRSRK